MIRGRSPVARAAIRAASPLAMLVGAYLFFAGHNRPGGGFAAGLVVGAVVALRMIVGLPRPRDATRSSRREALGRGSVITTPSPA